MINIVNILFIFRNGSFSYVKRPKLSCTCLNKKEYYYSLNLRCIIHCWPKKFSFCWGKHEHILWVWFSFFSPLLLDHSNLDRYVFIFFFALVRVDIYKPTFPYFWSMISQYFFLCVNMFLAMYFFIYYDMFFWLLRFLSQFYRIFGISLWSLLY